MFRGKKIFFVLGLCIILFVSAFYYLLFTTKGSNSIVKLAISQYSKLDDVKIKKTEGSLSDKLILRDVEIKNIKWLPEGSILKIIEVEADLNFLNLKKSYLKINNSTLYLTGIGKFLIYGKYQGNLLDFNIYSKHINLDQLLDTLPVDSKLKKISGVINDFDLYLKGSFSKPQVFGEFKIAEIRQEGFAAVNCPGSFNLELKDVSKEMEVYGQIKLKSGKLNGKKTATVILEPSSIIFEGNLKEPKLNFKANAYVEKIKIDIALKGTFNNPDLKLSSIPPMSKEKLLIMLATGKSWKGADTAAYDKGLPVGLAVDFLDYFIFSGSVAQLTKKLGVKDLSLKVDNSSKGLSMKKELNEKIDVLYETEQSMFQDSKPQTIQKVGVEYKITESISLDANREIKQNNKNESQTDKTKEDNKIGVQFKKEF